METMKVKILVTEKETKDGKKFKTYKAVSKNGRLVDAKFRKEVTNLPTENCYAHILPDNMNLDKSREYPVLWVNAVEEYTTIADSNTENNRKTLEEFFG